MRLEGRPANELPGLEEGAPPLAGEVEAAALLPTPPTLRRRAEAALERGAIVGFCSDATLNELDARLCPGVLLKSTGLRSFVAGELVVVEALSEAREVLIAEAARVRLGDVEAAAEAAAEEAALGAVAPAPCRAAEALFNRGATEGAWRLFSWLAPTIE